jgi:hypothetical protein
MRGRCSAHAIPRAGQLLAGLLVTASGTAVHQLPCPQESTRAARQPPFNPRPARKRSEARAPAGQLAVYATQRQRAAARQELGVPAFRAYPSGLQTLTETAAVCADDFHHLRRCREPVLGEFRSRCTCMQRSKVCYAYLLFTQKSALPTSGMHSTDTVCKKKLGLL